MPGFDQHSAGSQKDVPEAVNVRSTRFGWFLFIIYALLYGAFVLINAFAPQMMELTPLGGVNLAILLGLGVIGAAFVLALLYDWLCRLLAVPRQNDREAGK